MKGKTGSWRKKSRTREWKIKKEETGRSQQEDDDKGGILTKGKVSIWMSGLMEYHNHSFGS